MSTQKDNNNYIPKDVLLEWAESCKKQTDINFAKSPNPELAIKSDMWAVFISKIESL